MISGSTLHVAGGGSANITAIQAGDNTYGAAIGVIQVLNVAKAQLTATGNNASKTYGNVNPGFSINYSGFVGNRQCVGN